jgi:hypothetical protein
MVERGGNGLDLYSKDIWFHSRSGRRLFMLKFSVIFTEFLQANVGTATDISRNRPFQFIIHQSPCVS